MSWFVSKPKEKDPDDEIVLLDISKFDASIEVKQFLMLLIIQSTPYGAFPVPGSRYQVRVKRRVFKTYPHLKQFTVEDDVSEH